MDDILGDIFSDDEDVENSNPNAAIIDSEANPKIQRADEVSPNPAVIDSEAKAERNFTFSPKIQKAEGMLSI